ncbi:uncharacterized protein LOC107617026 isoform X4 [Arachis ipaensis]|uniref:uncharacterized protein LOC107617026 isoform X4 n=1 Tax=Arachis ipaensis TaxID=130454 RepID=UPI000A2B098C|nr:uncharacterized protein LOC107617026 isoform X4 [Arachis ipaensis]
MKPFFASTGQLWKEQKLAEKPARFGISTGTQDKKITCKCKAKITMDIGGAYIVSKSHSAIWKNGMEGSLGTTSTNSEYFASTSVLAPTIHALLLIIYSRILRKKVKRWEVKVLGLSSELVRKGKEIEQFIKEGADEEGVETVTEQKEKSVN